MQSEGRSRIAGSNAGSLIGPIWFIGWLFTIAFAQLVWWEALVAILLWPYYLGLAVR